LVFCREYLAGPRDDQVRGEKFMGRVRRGQPAKFSARSIFGGMKNLGARRGGRINETSGRLRNIKAGCPGIDDDFTHREVIVVTL
jgi:hypothetical protein